MPRVNPSGKGRNVYDYDSDLLGLTVMEYLLEYHQLVDKATRL